MRAIAGEDLAIAAVEAVAAARGARRVAQRLQQLVAWRGAGSRPQQGRPAGATACPKPSRMPTPAHATCGMTSAPRARAASTPASTSRQSSGWFWLCTSPKLIGRRLARATASIHSSSPSVPPASSPAAPNGTSSKTPALHSASTAASASSSRRIGEGSRDGSPRRRACMVVRGGDAERAGAHRFAHAARMAASSASGRRARRSHRARPSRRCAAAQWLTCAPTLSPSGVEPRNRSTRERSPSPTAGRPPWPRCGMSSTPSIRNMR